MTRCSALGALYSNSVRYVLFPCTLWDSIVAFVSKLPLSNAVAHNDNAKRAVSWRPGRRRWFWPLA